MLVNWMTCEVDLGEIAGDNTRVLSSPSFRSRRRRGGHRHRHRWCCYHYRHGCCCCSRQERASF